MTLADILKPSLTVIRHAELRGLQLGAGAGTLLALPTLLIKPHLINPTKEPKLVAIANIAGIGALTGATAVTLACVYKMSKMTKKGIFERAEKLSTNAFQKRLDHVSAACAGLSAGLAIGRAIAISNNEDRCLYGVMFRKQTAWEIFAFGAMGAAVSAGFVVGGMAFLRVLVSALMKARGIDINNVKDEKDVDG